MEEKKSDGKYVASLVLGICSLSFGALILPIIGLVLSVKSRNELKERNETNGMVTAGLVLNIIGLIKGVFATLAIIFWIFIVILSIIADSSATTTTTKTKTKTHTPSYKSSSYYSYY